MTDEEKDYEAIKAYIDLWKNENPIKTNKLQVLLIVNGLLISAVQVAGGFKAENWSLFLAGSILSLIWVVSIGRTCLFQRAWHIKINNIASKAEYAGDPRFSILNITDAEKEAPAWMRFFGGLSSKYYLLGAPILFSTLWFVALLYVLIKS